MQPKAIIQKNLRNQSFDALKGAAIIAVCFSHVPASEITQGHAWQIFDLLGRFAVPCFFAISGYFFRLSWERTEDKNGLLIRSMRRIIPAFLVWALFYAIIPPYSNVGTIQNLRGIWQYPHSFIFAGNVYHLWFLSSLLQGLVALWMTLKWRCLPLALLVGSFLFIISLLGGTYSMTQVGHAISFEMKNGPFFSTLFVMLGAMMAGKQLHLGTRAAIACIVTAYVVMLAEITVLHLFYQQPFRGQGVLIGTVPLALGAVNLARLNRFDSTMLATVGKYTMGIYLIHPWIYEVTKLSHLSPLQAFPVLWFLLTFAGSLLFAWAAAKVPGVRRICA